MIDREDDKFLAGDIGDDRQRSVHRCGASRAYGCQRAEEAGKQRGPEQSDDLTRYVGEQGYRAELRAAIFGDEYARQGVIAEAASHGEHIRDMTPGHQQRYEATSGEGADNGDDGKQ